MFLKMLGVVMVIAGCAGTGISMVSAHRRECRCLKQLSGVLDYMGFELQYRLTPLPELCRLAAERAEGNVRRLMITLAKELEQQVRPDAASCMRSAMKEAGYLPPVTARMAERLGSCLGIFDLQGQLNALEAVRTECRQETELLTQNQEIRLRSYRTLGICSGAALVILLL